MRGEASQAGVGNCSPQGLPEDVVSIPKPLEKTCAKDSLGKNDARSARREAE